jgi:hypothetical protein
VSQVSPALLERVRSEVRRATQIAEGRYALEIPPDMAPERVLANLTAAGAQLVSLNPMRETLEDLFVRQVEKSEARTW